MNPDQKHAYDTVLTIADMQPPTPGETMESWMARAVTEGFIDDKERMQMNRSLVWADTAEKTINGIRAQLVS